MAGPWSKSSSMPLETFLDTVAPLPAEGETSGQSEPADKKWDKNWEEGARAVILTILSNVPNLPAPELRAHSEFPTDVYDEVVSSLLTDGLIRETGGIVSLTEPGKEAAKRERDRLLGSL